MRSAESILPSLPPLRLVNRRTQEHVGACPFCGGDHRSDRFHVWMEPGHERYWCRACDARGPLKKLLGEEARPRLALARRRPARAAAPAADVAHVTRYRQIYATVALWAHALLLDEANPEPLAYLRGRGFSRDAVGHALLGVTLRDPSAIPELLRRECPDLLPHAEAAGVLSRDHSGALRGHPNLCGALLFPYLANSEVVDLRTRSFPGKGYKSLPGGYAERGATAPFGWDSLSESDTVILTEGELKALSVTQAQRAGRLSLPGLAHPGLSYLREEWATQLLAHGVRTVVLAYDSGVRPVKDGLLQLAPEETWSLRHGLRLAEAGLSVRVLRLPLAPGETKADLDAFLLQHGPGPLQRLIDSAPTLADYHRSLPRGLLRAARLPTSPDFPLRRARPRRLEAPPDAAAAAPPAAPGEILGLSAAREQIAELVRDHALSGEGFLVLAHPPGAGKGHNTVLGLRAFLQAHEAPGQIVWTAPRKEQIRDQEGLDLTPLHGRNAGNCRRLPEAQALSARGYSVRDALCQRRCPFVDHCAYLRQFGVEADRFAPQPLLQATGWWQEAGVLVLDEFDPARLTRTISLTSADLAAIARPTPCPHAQSVLRWLGQLLGSAGDRTLAGPLMLPELAALARADGLELEPTLRAAEAGLPDEREQQLLPGLPQGATLADFEALPPNYLAVIVGQLRREQLRAAAGTPGTSRLEVAAGQLFLYLRVEHLIRQLASPAQPKVILDATVSEGLLRSLFPATPIRVERPAIAGGARIVQVVARDWAKTTLRGQRRERWYDAVAARIRPGRPTLIVCTLACEEDLRRALAARGHTDVALAHYGALRGSNAYKGYDVILSQVYHPNLDAIVREGRALFADDAAPLDERVTLAERVLRDSAGEAWAVQVPTFADARLATLLEQRREAELVQAALRGRPLDHPEAQVTLLFGLPLPGLTPTLVEEDAAPGSNAGREGQARDALAAAAQGLLDGGARVLGVDDLAAAGGQSVVTVRKHMAAVAGRLGLRLITQRRVARGGQRVYERAVLVRRGRYAPPRAAQEAVQAAEDVGDITDQASNMAFTSSLIRAPRNTSPRRSAGSKPPIPARARRRALRLRR